MYDYKYHNQLKNNQRQNYHRYPISLFRRSMCVREAFIIQITAHQIITFELQLAEVIKLYTEEVAVMCLYKNSSQRQECSHPECQITKVIRQQHRQIFSRSRRNRYREQRVHFEQMELQNQKKKDQYGNEIVAPSLKTIGSYRQITASNVPLPLRIDNLKSEIDHLRELTYSLKQKLEQKNIL